MRESYVRQDLVSHWLHWYVILILILMCDVFVDIEIKLILITLRYWTCEATIYHLTAIVTVLMFIINVFPLFPLLCPSVSDKVGSVLNKHILSLGSISVLMLSSNHGRVSLLQTLSPLTHHSSLWGWSPSRSALTTNPYDGDLHLNSYWKCFLCFWTALSIKNIGLNLYNNPHCVCYYLCSYNMIWIGRLN